MKKRPTAPNADAPRGPRDDATPGERDTLLPAWRAVLDPRGPYLVPLLLLAIARLVAWRLLPFAAEDAYITFRYARNLAGGFGLVYNPAERVFGFSSAPWTAWAALGIALLRDPVTWTRLTSLAADGLTLVLVGRMLEREAGPPGRPARACAWCFTLFFALWPYFAFLCASGMESSAMLALIALAAALARRGSRAAGPALAGMMIPASWLWSCTSCLACDEVCPLGIQHLPLILQMRRDLVARGEVGDRIQDTLTNVQRYGNSLGQSPRNRARWVKDLPFEVRDARKEPVEYLWFVGDYASFDPRAQAVTMATAPLSSMRVLRFGCKDVSARSARAAPPGAG